MSFFGNTVGFASELADASLQKRVILPEGGKNLYDIDKVIPSSDRCTVNKMYMTTLDANRYDVSMTVRSTKAEGTFHCVQPELPVGLKAGVTYTMSLTLEEAISGVASFGFRNAADNNMLNGRTTCTEAGKRYSRTYTPAEDVSVYFSVFVTDGTVGMMGEATFANIMVEEGAAATEYEPYYKGLSWVYNELQKQEDQIDSLNEQVDSLYEIVNTLLEG